MTLRKVQAYCFIALAIMLFCACQEKEDLEIESSEDRVTVELSVSRATGSPVTDESSMTGEDAINSVRIIIFRHEYASGGDMEYRCEYNQKITRTKDTNAGGSAHTWPADATSGHLYCSKDDGFITFNLGRAITTGSKKVLLLVNEESYFSDTDGKALFENAAANGDTEKTGFLYSELIAAINNKTAAKEPSATANAGTLFMTSITETNIHKEWNPDTPFSLTVTPVVRATAKIDATIRKAEGLSDDWKVTKVTITNCANQVGMDGALASTSWFQDGSTPSANKVYDISLPVPAPIAASANEVTISDSKASTLFENQYVYENIIASNDDNITAHATRLTVTLSQTAVVTDINTSPTKDLIIYVGNGKIIIKSDDIPVVTALDQDTPAQSASTYSVYRNHHYKLNIKIKPKDNSSATTMSIPTGQSTIIPRSILQNNDSLDGVHFEVALTCVEE